MRQHVNPLSRYFQLPLDIPPPSDLFVDSSLPLHIDIGSARGKFLIHLAQIESSWNYLGVEIRQPLVLAAEKERVGLDLNNLRFHFCNANISLEAFLKNIEKGLFKRVSIQFPDPWFKRRHFKRRVLNSKLLVALTNSIEEGGELFIQSDIEEVILTMMRFVQLTKCFDLQYNNDNFWLEDNPFGINTEREKYALRNGLKVYRALFIRNHTILPANFELLQSDENINF